MVGERDKSAKCEKGTIALYGDKVNFVSIGRKDLELRIRADSFGGPGL